MQQMMRSIRWSAMHWCGLWTSQQAHVRGPSHPELHVVGSLRSVWHPALWLVVGQLQNIRQLAKAFHGAVSPQEGW
eukprot:14323424-Alexandrium_andersonii.AAC.1